MPYQINIDDRTIEADIVKRKPQLRIRIGEREHTISQADCPASGDFKITVDGNVYHGWRYATSEEVYMRFNGRTHIISVPRGPGATSGDAGSSDEIRADMPGTVVSLNCADGDEVKSGQQILTVESMKLQIGLIAPRDGVIKKVHFQSNASFDRGAILVSLVPLEDGDE